MTCDDYQIALDQLAAGASSAIPAADVHAHIVACAACTTYASLSKKVTVSMTNALAMSPPPLDVDAMRARVSQFRRQARRALTIGPVVFGAAMLVNRLIGNWPGSLAGAIVGAAVGTAAFYAMLALLMRRQISRLVVLEAKSGDDLVAGLRAELDRRLRREREAWWLLPILLVFYHWNFVGLALPSQPFTIAFELCYLAVIPLGIVRYRRAKRERALLA